MAHAEIGSPRARVPFYVWAFVLAGLLALGFASILVRYTVPEPGVIVAFWRLAIVVAITTPVLLFRERHAVARLEAADWLRIGFAGVMLGLHFIAWIQALHHTSVASASVFVATSPLFIALLGWIVLRERVSWRIVVSIGVAMVGALLIAWADSGEGLLFPRAPLGNSLALTAALLFSIYILIGRAVRQRIGFLPYFVPLNAVAAVTALAGCLIQGVGVSTSFSVFGICVLLAVGPGLLGHGSMILAVRHLRAAVVGLLMLSEPVMAGVLAWILFDEVPSTLSVVGIILVLCSIAVVVVRRVRPVNGSASRGGH